ncbi:hypothetical protein N8963_02880 [Candidatus Pelagibacter sp.]|nr:hypothetical protein [Candidatus Pelagibacter sp.]
MKNKFYNEIFYIIFLLFFYSSISFYYALEHINSHWTAVYDDELTLVYNALLYNSGIEQEYTDHSGYFTILSTSIYLKILNFFGIIEIYKFSQIHEFDLDQIFKNSIYHMRVFSIFVSAVYLISATYLFNILFKNKLFSFLLGVILFCLYGNLTLLSGVRTEQFSALFLMMSLIGLFNFFEKNRLIFLIMFLFFLFCSILNKSQVIFHLPIILLYSFYINKKSVSFDINLEIIPKKNKILLYIYIFLFTFLTLKSLIFLRDFKTWIFLITILFILNFFFLKLSNKKKLIDNLLIFNSSIIFSYVIFNLVIFLHPSASLNSLEDTIFAVVSGTVVYRPEIADVTFVEFVIGVMKIIPQNFILLFDKFFLSINTYSIILISLIIIFIINFKNYQSNDKKMITLLLISFFGIYSINLIRGDASYYNIFTDYILIIFFWICFKKFV